MMRENIKNYDQDKIMKIIESERFFLFLLSALCLLVIISLVLPVFSQETPPPAQDQQVKARPHFYNVDREVTIEGQVEELKFEARYEGKGHFLILIVMDKNNNELVEVETAPAWFFRIDVHKGERIRLIGSLAEEQEGGKKLVIAREMKINNQTIIFRDRRGFPTWSRGQGQRKGSNW